MKLRIKKNDAVRVISGHDKGKQGKVTQVFPTQGLLVIEGINLRTKHLRAQKGSKTGSKVQYAAPLEISKLAVICPQCGKTTRVRIAQTPDGKKIRTCHRCAQPLNV
jgi:large subunit ribosomal protein L24